MNKTVLEWAMNERMLIITFSDHCVANSITNKNDKEWELAFAEWKKSMAEWLKGCGWEEETNETN